MHRDHVVLDYVGLRYSGETFDESKFSLRTEENYKTHVAMVEFDLSLANKYGIKLD